MKSISPYDLETNHTYYIESYVESYVEGVRINKYRGVINNLNACTWYEHNVLEIGNMIVSPEFVFMIFFNILRLRMTGRPPLYLWLDLFVLTILLFVYFDDVSHFGMLD